MMSGRALRLIAATAMVASALITGPVAPALAAGEIAQTFFVPLPEDELRTSASNIRSTSTNVVSVISMVVAVSMARSCITTIGRMALIPIR